MKKLAQSLRQPGGVLLAIFWIGALLLSVLLIFSGDETSKHIGFFVIGALIAATAGALAEIMRRPIRATELARVLHLELAQLAARCCYDLENPWSQWLDIQVCRLVQTNVRRVKKFAPATPVIYLALAPQIDALPIDASQALMQFHFRIEAWRREVSAATEGESTADQVAPEAVLILATRLRQTIGPGLHALQQLGALVDNPEEIEAVALGAFDQSIPHNLPGTLRERLLRLA